MRLGGYYKQAALYPLVIVALLVIPFSIADNYDYKSEWMTAGEVIFLAIAFSILCGLIISALATTIFLNKFKKVRSNRLLALLSWFLLPFGFIAAVATHIILYEIDESDGSFMYMLLINVPFILGLIRSYYKYSKANLAGSESEADGSAPAS